MQGDLALWQRLLEPACAPLRDAATQVERPEPADIASLRRHWPAELVPLALELAAARRKAASKLSCADRIVADVTGVEQASSTTTARHKAKRFADAGVTRVADLCCGIGGDAMQLAEACDVLAVDVNPVRAWMAGRNASVPSSVEDVTTMTLGDAAVHVDPDRRPVSGRRAWRYEDYRPGPAFIERLVREQPAVAVKLGPGVDLAALPDPTRCEVELISERGSLVQAVLWGGTVCRHPGQRTATRLPEGLTVTGPPAPPPRVETDRFGMRLLVPDPALERAGLVGLVAAPLGLTAPDPGPGLLTTDTPVASPWLTAFAVQMQMPWRSSPVRRWLSDHDAGIVEVKTRGRVVDTDRAQRELRGRGEIPYTVFVLRMGTAVHAVITRREACSQ